MSGVSSECKNELVERLSKMDSDVLFDDRVKDFKQVKERIDDGFVFVKFTQTKGGTELGINLVKGECNFDDADFEKGTGKLRVVGTCELNYCKVKCIANVDLSTREGKGHLELIGD